MKRFLFICITFICTLAKLHSQIDTSDAVYFHNMMDTVITMNHADDSDNNPGFNLYRRYFDSLSIYPGQWTADTHISNGTLEYLDDSLRLRNYRPGTRVVNKVIYNTEFKASGQRVKDLFGYTEVYTVIDQRIYKNQVVFSDTATYRFHFPNGSPVQATLHEKYIPRTAVWVSVDGRLTQFLNITHFTDTDNDLNEISVTKWVFDMKK